MSFAIGQIIFIAPNSTNDRIIPAMISQEIRTKTVEGELVTYKVLIGAPNSPKSKTIPSDKINGRLFSSLEELKIAVMQDVEVLVDERCSAAKQLADQIYGTEEDTFKIEQPEQQGDKGGKINPVAVFDDVSRPEPQSQVININGNRAQIAGNHQEYNNGTVNVQHPQMSLEMTRQRMREKMLDDPNREIIVTENGTLREVQKR